MKRSAFDELARLPVIQYYEAAFSKATGVPLKLVPPDAPRQPFSLGPFANVFCDLVARTPAGCDACRKTHQRAQEGAARERVPQQIHCFAGMTVVAVPVVVGGQHLATLLSGQVFRRPPTERDFRLVAKIAGGERDGDWVKQARKAYFETPVVTADRFQAITHLVSVFGQHLADYAGRCAIGAANQDPAAVAGAKRFIHAHLEERITLDRVVQQVRLNRFYFCKLFRKATGMTLTEYVAQTRVEKAKTLLLDHSARITEVAFAAGFGSIPRFNSLFRRYVGMSPSQYRAALRSELRA